MIDNDTMEMVCGIAGKALRDVAREADMTKPGDAELIKNLVSTIYKADTLMEDGGHSRGGDWYAEGNYSRNYDGGSSYARRRDSMGRYSRREYSRDSIADHLDAMMREADTEDKREKIRRFREQMMM